MLPLTPAVVRSGTTRQGLLPLHPVRTVLLLCGQFASPLRPAVVAVAVTLADPLTDLFERGFCTVEAGLCEAIEQSSPVRKPLPMKLFEIRRGYIHPQKWDAVRAEGVVVDITLPIHRRVSFHPIRFHLLL